MLDWTADVLRPLVFDLGTVDSAASHCHTGVTVNCRHVNIDTEECLFFQFLQSEVIEFPTSVVLLQSSACRQTEA